MKIGTKSVLFGAHCFFIHPWFVALGWWKLYGFPFDPRLWAAFFLHDIGYVSKPNMDGVEGEQHPHLGANIMHRLFDRSWELECGFTPTGGYTSWRLRSTKWHDFTLYHSRHLAKLDGKNYSRLCVADKLAGALTPWWLYLPMVTATGEIKEYMGRAQKMQFDSKPAGMTIEEFIFMTSTKKRDWFMAFQSYMLRWVKEHKDLKEDKWTTQHQHS